MKLPSLNQLIALAAVIVAALALWTFWPRETPEVSVAAPLPPAKEVRSIEKVIERPKLIYVYPDEVKPKLGLGAEILGNANAKVTSAGKLRAEERDYTISAVLDTGTGDSQVFARPDPLPWIGPGRRGAVGLAYGLANGEPTGKLYAQHDLLQVKALHAGARAEVDQRGEWWAGGYVELRF